MSLSKRAQLSILYPLATTVVLLAEELENWANSRLFKWKTKSIPNPVMEPPKNKYATTSKPEKKIILGMGRFIKRKQFDLLIKIFSRLEKKFPDWNLHIVGDGPERPNLKALIHSLNLEERVFLEQWSNDPYEWYYRAELFAFTSSFEGFGMTLAEALTCQLPVISFDCPYGPSRIIDHQVNGYLVPLDDTKEFENKLGSLMNDEKLRTHLGSNGSKVLDKFSYNTIMKEWETLIRN
ncbi:MAG: glycosyltransferase [Opitutales bacterium]|nr:glycosyltransferase [Opitutales bacterium]